MIAFRAKLRTGPARALPFAVGAALAAALVTGSAVQAGGRKLDPVAAIQASLAKGMVGGAILGGEKALTENPRDAALRAALGSAYLRAGRFQSAAVMLNDAVTLGDASGRTALSLALAETAIGHNRDALGVLAQARSVIPASDLGLAVALAGDPDHGIEVLTEAVRGESTPKARQNLAYAYALAGRWSDAKLIASADVAPDQIETRVAQWMISVQAGDAGMRVAGLLGVTAVSDPGVPTALALVDAPAPALAAAAPATDASGELKPAPTQAAPAAAADAPAAPVALAVAAPAPVPAPAASAQATPIEGPTLTFVSNPVIQAIPVKSVEAPAHAVAVAAPAPVMHHAAARVAAVPSTDGSHLVQLGAFSSAANAERAKKILAARVPGLKGHAFVVTEAQVGGRKFWRVAASGFDAGSASGTCARIRQTGGGCFAYEPGRGLVGGQALAAMTAHSPSLAARRR